MPKQACWFNWKCCDVTIQVSSEEQLQNGKGLQFGMHLEFNDTVETFELPVE